MLEALPLQRLHVISRKVGKQVGLILVKDRFR